MPFVEELKRIVEKLTGIGRPRRRELARLARPRAPQLFRFRDDGQPPSASGLSRSTRAWACVFGSRCVPKAG